MRQTVTESRLFSKKDLRKLIIPLILEQTLAITVGMADTMMISSAGEAAVSGVSLVDMFNNLIISVLAALATGGAVVTSQCIGAGRREEACRSARQLVFTGGGDHDRYQCTGTSFSQADPRIILRTD